METLPEKKTIDEIISLHNDIIDHLKTSIDKAFKVGELLDQQREKLNHGEWLPWVKDNLPFSDQTARNYIKLFHNKEKLKFKNVLNLSQAYQMLLPPKVLAAQDIAWEELPEKDEHEKMVKVSDLEFNPFFGIWSINAEMIEYIRNGIIMLGFYNSFMARKRNGKYQIAYGHHRLTALRLTDIKEVAIYLREMTDDEMVKIMSFSNQYRWNVSPDTIIDTIRGTHDYLISKGKPADIKAIYQFLKPSIDEWQVREAFNTLYEYNA